MVALESERAKSASLDKKQRKFDQSLAEEKAISERLIEIFMFVFLFTPRIGIGNLAQTVQHPLLQICQMSVGQKWTFLSWRLSLFL